MRTRRRAGATVRTLATLATLVAVGTLGAVLLPAGQVLALTAVGGGPGEGQPGAEELAAQARAGALHDEARTRSAGVQDAREALREASRAAAAALQAYSIAARARDAAEADVSARQAALVQARLDVAAGQQGVARWARQAYVSGGGIGDSPALTMMTGGSTEGVSLASAVLSRIGQGRTAALDAVRVARAAADAAAVAAERAAEAARRAADEALAARRLRDDALAHQREVLDRAESALERTRAAEAGARRRAQALAAERLGASGGSARGPVALGPVGSCRGGDVSGYGNGRLPVALLCPLPGAPGEFLRADAAAAFDGLRRAYAAAFGRPLCVTDAYRSYPEQVAVYARTPQLAARPGTSNHGWGTALDLCGGIQSFGTAAHAWMLLHAPAYGWFHPSWAEPTGSMPEPWHWEFGGG